MREFGWCKTYSAYSVDRLGVDLVSGAWWGELQDYHGVLLHLLVKEHNITETNHKQRSSLEAVFATNSLNLTSKYYWPQSIYIASYCICFRITVIKSTNEKKYMSLFCMVWKRGNKPLQEFNFLKKILGTTKKPSPTNLHANTCWVLLVFLDRFYSRANN